MRRSLLLSCSYSAGLEESSVDTDQASPVPHSIVLGPLGIGVIGAS